MIYQKWTKNYIFMIYQKWTKNDIFMIYQKWTKNDIFMIYQKWTKNVPKNGPKMAARKATFEKDCCYWWRKLSAIIFLNVPN